MNTTIRTNKQNKISPEIIDILEQSTCLPPTSVFYSAKPNTTLNNPNPTYQHLLVGSVVSYLSRGSSPDAQSFNRVLEYTHRVDATPTDHNIQFPAELEPLTSTTTSSTSSSTSISHVSTDRATQTTVPTLVSTTAAISTEDTTIQDTYNAEYILSIMKEHDGHVIGFATYDYEPPTAATATAATSSTFRHFPGPQSEYNVRLTRTNSTAGQGTAIKPVTSTNGRIHIPLQAAARVKGRTPTGFVYAQTYKQFPPDLENMSNETLRDIHKAFSLLVKYHDRNIADDTDAILEFTEYFTSFSTLATDIEASHYSQLPSHLIPVPNIGKLNNHLHTEKDEKACVAYLNLFRGSLASVMNTLTTNAKAEIAKEAAALTASNIDTQRKLYGVTATKDIKFQRLLRDLHIDCTTNTNMEEVNRAQEMFDTAQKRDKEAILKKYAEKRKEYVQNIHKIRDIQLDKLHTHACAINLPHLIYCSLVVLIIEHTRSMERKIHTEIEYKKTQHHQKEILLLEARKAEKRAKMEAKDTATAINLTNGDPNTIAEAVSVAINKLINEKGAEICQQLQTKGKTPNTPKQTQYKPNINTFPSKCPQTPTRARTDTTLTSKSKSAPTKHINHTTVTRNNRNNDNKREHRHPNVDGVHMVGTKSSTTHISRSLNARNVQQRTSTKSKNGSEDKKSAFQHASASKSSTSKQQSLSIQPKSSVHAHGKRDVRSRKPSAGTVITPRERVPTRLSTARAAAVSTSSTTPAPPKRK